MKYLFEIYALVIVGSALLLLGLYVASECVMIVFSAGRAVARHSFVVGVTDEAKRAECAIQPA